MQLPPPDQFPDTVHVGIRVVRIGRSSMALEHAASSQQQGRRRGRHLDDRRLRLPGRQAADPSRIPFAARSKPLRPARSEDNPCRESRSTTSTTPGSPSTVRSKRRTDTRLGQFVVEGEKLVERLLASRFPPVSVLVTDRHEPGASFEVPDGIPVYVVPTS